MSLKAEEFVKTFTKEEILDALFCKKCLNERATRNLCVALFEEKSDRLLKKWNKAHPDKNRKVYENLCSSRKTLKN